MGDITRIAGSIQVRDTKEVQAGYTEGDRIVCLTKQQWQQWVLDPVKKDELPTVFAKLPNGSYVLCNPVVLEYTENEVDEFVTRAKEGDVAPLSKAQ